MNTPVDTPHWLWLARVLLLPTPLLAVDPEGEAERARNVQDAFKEAGLEPLDPAAWKELCKVARGKELRLEGLNSTLHAWAEAIRDAWHLHVGHLDALAETRQTQARHPLSGEAGSTLMTQDKAATCWNALWPKLKQLLPANGQDAQAWNAQRCPEGYRRLWQTLMGVEGTDTDGRDTFLPAHEGLPDHSALAHRSMTAALLHARREGGTAALAYFHVGPVQSFIAASRRMHDLQVGSYLLVYLTWQAVRSLAEAEGPQALIYPALEHLPLALHELFGQRQERVERETLLHASIANRFLCLVPESQAAARLEAAANAVLKRWEEVGNAVLSGLDRAALEASEEVPIQASRWCKGALQQLRHHLEVDAWLLPWPQDAEAAQQMLKQVLSEKEVTSQGVYGALFGVCQGSLAAHRATVAPGRRIGDHRPKCVQCGRLEQLGPVLPDNLLDRQQACSRAFWQKLSESIQETCQGKGAQGGEKNTSLQLNVGEALCAVCLTKRFAPQHWFGTQEAGFGLDWRNTDDRKMLRFPSLESIASAPFRQRLLDRLGNPAEDDRKLYAHWLDALGELHRALDFTPPGNLLKGFRIPKAHAEIAKELLEQEGSFLYPSSYEPETVWRDHKTTPFKEDDRDTSQITLLALQAGAAFAKLSGAVGAAASPYLALVMMDGDDMGLWLSGKNAPPLSDLGLTSADGVNQKRPLSPSLHAELSRRQGRLAITNLRAVTEKHLGRLFYSGGDDLLACFPLQTVWQALSALRTCFQSYDGLGKKLTFSAGVVLYHSRTPFQKALQEARAQEKQAKSSGKDCVVVRYVPRSGSASSLRLSWQQVEDLPELLTILNNQKQGTSSAQEERPDLDIAQQAEREAFALGLLDSGRAVRNSESCPSPSPELLEGFQKRLLHLLGASRDDASRRQKIQRLLTEFGSERGSTVLDAQCLVDRLKLLRFLQRELHGLAPRIAPADAQSSSPAPTQEAQS